LSVGLPRAKTDASKSSFRAFGDWFYSVLAIKGNRRYNCLQDLIFSTDVKVLCRSHSQAGKSEILIAGI
jgi:hypothetical protein